MPDFEFIDVSQFLQSPKRASKTSKTLIRVRDEETFVSGLGGGYQRKPAKPPAESSEGVKLADNSNLDLTGKFSIAVPDANNSFAGLAGSFGEGEKTKSVRVEGRGTTIPRLPWQLERLVSAASSGLLAGFTFDGVPDINNYVMAWACAYLVGDQQHALDRLRQVQLAREVSQHGQS